MKRRNTAYNFFLTSRPYSYAGEIARSIVFTLLLAPASLPNTLIYTVIITLLMWLYFNWQSDWIQKDPGRITPSVYLCFGPLLVAFILSYIEGHLLGILGVLIYSCTILLYPLKARYKKIGVIGPLLRAITILGHFVMISACLHQFPTNTSILIVVVIASFKGIRNLIGDIRDIKTDKWELPARFGITKTTNILRLSFLFTIVLSLMIHERNIFLLTIFLAGSSWIVFEMLILILEKSQAYMVGYLCHRYMILSISTYLIILAIFLGLQKIDVVLLSMILIISQLFYNSIPGKNYPNFKESVKKMFH